MHTPRTSFSLRIDKNQDRINQLREMLDEGEQPLCQVQQANCEPEACGAREFGAHSTGGHGASALRTLADLLSLATRSLRLGLGGGQGTLLLSEKKIQMALGII